MNKRLLKDIASCHSSYPLEFPFQDSNRFISTILNINQHELNSNPFHGGSFHLEICIPNDYPHVPPLITFKTRIFHPNIHFENGQICLDGLSEGWLPSFTLKSILDGIVHLLNVSFHSYKRGIELNCIY